MKLSFSLNSKSKPNAKVGSAPSFKKPTAFASLDDDDNTTADAAPTASSSRSTEANKKLAVQSSGGSWRAGKKKAQKVDASIAQYDEVYDDMKEAARRAKEAKEDADKEKKVRLLILTLRFCS